MLPLQHVAQRLQGTFVGATNGPSSPAIVEERIDRLLEHAHFVPDDDTRRFELNQALQAIVPIDDTPVQIVQIRRSEPSSVERHEGTQLGGKDGDHVHDHPFGLVARLSERFNDLQALRVFLLERDRRGTFCLCLQLVPQPGDVDLLEQVPDRLGANAGLECSRTMLSLTFAEIFLRQELFLVEVRLTRINHHIGFKI